MQPSKGNIDPEQAFFNEFHHWGNLIHDTNIEQFILSDITNYARIGDLITINSNGTLEIQEIKSGKSQRGRKRRAQFAKQEEKRKQFEELANNGETNFEGTKLKILETNVPFKTSLDEVEKTIYQSIDGMNGHSINPYLNIVCFDTIKIEDRTISKEEYVHTLDTYSKPINDDDKVWTTFSFQKTAYSPNFLPFTIYPFKEELISDLMFGRIEIFYSFNMGEFYQQLESKNWKVTKRLEDWDINKIESPEAFVLCIKMD